jgi:hypothetical protein
MIGHSPIGTRIDAGKVDVAVTEHGFIDVEKQMHTNVLHIFAVGDVIGQLTLAHNAVQEAYVATKATHGNKSFFDIIPRTTQVACTTPEIGWTGLAKEQCNAQCIDFGKPVFPMATSGCAFANCHSGDFSKPIFDAPMHQVIGSGIVDMHTCGLSSVKPFLQSRSSDHLQRNRYRHDDPFPSNLEEIFQRACGCKSIGESIRDASWMSNCAKRRSNINQTATK